MPTYEVTVREVTFLSAYFEAKDEEEARELAAENEAGFTEVDGEDAEIVSVREVPRS